MLPNSATNFRVLMNTHHKAKAIFIGSSILVMPTVRAEVVTYQIDSTVSELSFTGESSFILTTAPQVPQGPGGMTTKYSGTIVADVTPTGIRFLAGTELRALNGGTWRPKVGGSTPGDTAAAPANYGYTVDIFNPEPTLAVAIRDLLFGLSTDDSLPVAAGVFPTAGIAGEVLAGTADTDRGNPPQTLLTFVDPFETEGLATGTITSDGSTETITLPLSFPVVLQSIVYTESYYTGTIVARRVTGAVDGDNDGLPDAWEDLKIGDRTQGADDDEDKDGVKNLIEYLLDGYPKDGSDVGKLRVSTVDTDASGGKELVITVALPSGFAFPPVAVPSLTSISGGITVAVEGSLDLSAFDQPVGELETFSPPVPLPSLSSGYTYRHFRLENSDGLLAGGFLRLRASTH